MIGGVLDTEYGIGESSKNHNSRNTPVKQKNGRETKIVNPNYSLKEWDNNIPTFKYWSEIHRTTKNFLCFGANYFPEIVGTVFKPVRRDKFVDFIKDNPRHWIIWDKMNGENDFNDCEMIYVREPIDSFIIKYMWAGMMQGSRLDGTRMEGNKKLNEKRIHPTQKPVRIYEILIVKLNIKGVCVDTNTGSAGFVIAAYIYKLIVYGCDIDKEYYDDSIKRIEQHIAQLTLF